MGRAVQILAPAADGGGMDLNQEALDGVLCASEVADLPVAVLAIVGQRGTGKTRLLGAVLEAVSAVGATSGVGPTSAVGATSGVGPMSGLDGLWCTADRPGSAGVAAWSELLPITLPSGERAALLLLDTWGPFEPDCPPEQAAVVLRFCALASSLLVVQSNSGSESELSELWQLAEIGEAARAIRGCSPLQHVMFSLRRWSGTAPAGLQQNFEPLYDWARSSAKNERALTAMQEVSDWYWQIDLFLAPDSSPSDPTAAPRDLIAFLTKKMSSKRFDKAAVTARELGVFLAHLGAALKAAPADSTALLAALVKASHTLAEKMAEHVYRERMAESKRLMQDETMSVEDLRAAHARASHKAQMAFTFAPKMSRDDGDDEEEMKKRKLEKKFEAMFESDVADAKRFDVEAKSFNATLAKTCMDQYQRMMDNTLAKHPLMPLGDLIKEHETVRLKILSEFDSRKKMEAGIGDQQRLDLSNHMEHLFRSYSNDLNQKIEQAETEERKIPEVLKIAEKQYETVMSEFQGEKLDDVHLLAKEEALSLFDLRTKDMILSETKSDARSYLAGRLDDMLKNMQLQPASSNTRFDIRGFANTNVRGHTGDDNQGLYQLILTVFGTPLRSFLGLFVSLFRFIFRRN